MTDYWRLPRSTGDLAADWMAAAIALRTATTEDQRAAVRVRTADLAARQRAHNVRQRESLQTALDTLRPIWAAHLEAWREWFQGIAPVFAEIARRLGEQATAPPVIHEGAAKHARAHPIERARRNRGTGPPLPPLDGRNRR